ncbi:Fic family protein [bacterium]|nr:Fic family protein [bacterium]
MPNKMQVFNKIHNLRERYYKSSKNKQSLLKIIMEAEIPEHVYNSNAIENSTLTLQEIEKIILQIDLDRYVSEREIFEAKNLVRVMEYIDAKAKEKELDLDVMLFFHKILLSNINSDIAGRFRRGDEFVRVGAHIGAVPKDIKNFLENLIIEYKANNQEHIIKRISKLHLGFESIHPFIDGNGRIGRVINNFLLIREGYVPINIKYINRAEYYDAFQEFDQNKKTGIMEKIIGRALTSSYYKRLAYLEDKKIITLNDYAKKSKESHQNLLNKAKRQTIPAFREKGVWKIGSK